MIQFDLRIFSKWVGSTTNQVSISPPIFFVFATKTSPPNKKDHIVATSRSGKPTGMPPALQQLSLGFWRPKHLIFP